MMFGKGALWLLVGMVDDNPDVGSDHFNFNDELAAKGYNIKVTAGDGWDTSLKSADILGMTVYCGQYFNREPLPLKPSRKDCWPLHLKGSKLKADNR